MSDKRSCRVGENSARCNAGAIFCVKGAMAKMSLARRPI
jgi:hypothetical protein